MSPDGLLADLEWRGLVHQVTDPALDGVLRSGPVTAYVGFDPTADSLHLGHLMGIVGLMRLQRFGHRPIALAGGATGMIGDPSGKSAERQLLEVGELRANAEAIRSQLGRFLDFSDSAGDARAVMVDNIDWLGAAGLLDFLRDVGKHFTVNAMIAKDSVRTRLAERDQGISFTEFSYMLLQAHDFEQLFVRHGCRLQLGGSDQWGNITAGIDLIRRRHGAVAYGLTWPLVTKADGSKFGKTESGAIWLDARLTSPYAMFQFLIRTDDDLAPVYLRRFTFRGADEIAELDRATLEQPGRREAQRAVAHDVVTLVHGAGEASRAEHASRVLFSEDIRDLDEATLLAVTAEAPSTSIPAASLEGAGVAVVDLLVRTGLESSRGAARRTVEQGGAYLNNRKVSDSEEALTSADLLHHRYAVLRKGKSSQHLLKLA